MSFSFTPTTNTGLGGAAPGSGAPPSFGAATAAPNFNFAAPVSAAPTLSFGAAAAIAAPAFGAQPAAAPAFGAQQAAAPAFGSQPAAAPAFGSQPAAAPAFGSQPAAAPAFGAQPAAAPAFGSQPAAAPAFGAQPAAAPAFGAQPAGTAFPAVVTVAPTFNFATPTSSATTTAPAFAFATPTTAVAASAPGTGAMPASLGAGLGSFAFNKPQPTTAASLNFNTTTTTATAQPFQSGLRLGATATTTSANPIGGIFGSKPAQPATAPATFVGLGGIDVGANQPKLGDNKQDGVKIKETQVPDEIVKTVDALKTYIKQQKTTSSDIGRTSTSKFSNVSHEIMNLKWVLQNMANSVDVNNQQIKLLRQETSKAIQSLEMAQRTQDTPAGLQFEHSAPFQYFQCLVAKYEQDLISFRQQITLTERHMHALANPQSISPEDLKRGFRQLNESFISLAGRLHELHQRVEEQKEHYLNLRRYRLRDATNVFEKIDNPPQKMAEPQRISSGPTPFSNISAISTLNKSFAAAAAASATNAAAK